MNHLQAINRARKLLGKSARIEYRASAPADDEERALARTRYAEAKAARDAADRALMARQTELLKADAEYARLLELRKRAGDVLRATSSGNTHRVVIGTLDSIAGLGAFFIRAQGDNYADAVAKLEAEVAKTGAPRKRA